MSVLHSFAGKLDPVVRFADRKNLTPTMLMPDPKPAPDLTDASIEAMRQKNLRKASGYLGSRKPLGG